MSRQVDDQGVIDGTKAATGVPTSTRDDLGAGGPLEGYDPERVLFVGGASGMGIAWYRVALPAMYLGADWVCVSGDPPKFRLESGLVKGRTGGPDWTGYDVVVMQQVRGRRWLDLIRQLQGHGTKVLYDICDYVHAIRKLPDHDFTRAFSKAGVAEMELCMRVADGILTSTEFLARRYRRYAPTWCCRDGLDTARYMLTRPKRERVQIGWAGGTGHVRAMEAWLPAVRDVMRRHDDTAFVTVGQPFADQLADEFPGRTLSIPWALVDQYPAAMTCFDIALAPAGHNDFYKGKGDLRWVEASALGIPVIADPGVYPDIRHGVTGLHAADRDGAGEQLELLVTDPDLATRIGTAAREVVLRTRDMRVTVRQWERALVELLAASRSPRRGS